MLLHSLHDVVVSNKLIDGVGNYWMGHIGEVLELASELIEYRLAFLIWQPTLLYHFLHFSYFLLGFYCHFLVGP